MSIVRLQSSDGVIFDTDVEVAKCSGTIKTMMEECGIEADTVVPLSNVRSDILRKVLEWANHHVNNVEPLDDDEANENAKSLDDYKPKKKETFEFSEWDEDFLKVDQSTLFELISAANYLDAKELLDVAGKAVANMMKGKSPEEIRQTFNIENDFPEAEKEKIRKEDEWCAEADK